MASAIGTRLLLVCSFSLLALAGECDEERASSPDLERIVGGVVTGPCDYKYTASIRRRYIESHACAGVLITSRWVLTSASCVQYDLTGGFKVYIGGRAQDEAEEEKIAIGVFVPTGWRRNSLEGNDIALIQLSSASSIRPASLPTKAFELGEAHESLTALGWGRTSSRSGYSEFLRAAGEIKRVSQQFCTNIYGISGQYLLCAGGEGVGACEGDQGGPLVTANDVVVGIIPSYGNLKTTGCGTRGKPSLFTDVSRHVEWVTQTIQSIIP